MDLRLTAADLSFYVDVRLRSFRGRWLAVADIAGDPEIGLGLTAFDALTAALSSLGPTATSALLADPQLVGVAEH